jgi:hypothetical protein
MDGMQILYNVLVALHLLGMAAVVGSWFAVIRSPRILPAMAHGAGFQLLTGVLLVGLRESGAVDGDPLDRAKIAVKLGVAIIVTVLAWVNRKRDDVPAGVVHTVGGLAVVNVLVAAIWT